MKNLMIVSLTVIMVLTAGFSFAQGNKGRYLDLKDLEGLSNSAKAEVVERGIDKFKGGSAGSTLANIDPDKAEKWAKIISTTIKTISQDLAVSVNEFVKTDVGKITMALIVYKVIGDDIRHIVFGILGWFVTAFILVMSFRHFHGSQRVELKDKDGNTTEIKYVPRFKWAVDSRGGSEAKMVSGGLHAAMFIAITVLAWVTVVM